MTTEAFTIKTRTGKITPEWTFETLDDAERTLEEISRIFPHQKFYIFLVKISTLGQPLLQESNK